MWNTSPWTRWSRRPNGNWLFGFAAVFAIVGVVLIFVTLSTHGEAERSSLTQDRGAHATITVTSVEHVAHHHHSRHGSSHTTYDTIIHGRLDHAIHGGTNTAVHEHGYVFASPGEQRNVVVDPKDTSYSEPPGVAYETTFGWVIALVFCILSFVVAIASGVFAVRLRKRRLAATGAPPPPAGPPAGGTPGWRPSTWPPSTWPPSTWPPSTWPPSTWPPSTWPPAPPQAGGYPPPPNQPPPPYQPPAPVAQPQWTPTGGPPRWQPVPPSPPPGA